MTSAPLSLLLPALCCKHLSHPLLQHLIPQALLPLDISSNLVNSWQTLVPSPLVKILQGLAQKLLSPQPFDIISSPDPQSDLF